MDIPHGLGEFRSGLGSASRDSWQRIEREFFASPGGTLPSRVVKTGVYFRSDYPKSLTSRRRSPLGCTVSLEKVASRQQLEQHDAETEDVRSASRTLTAQLLRRRPRRHRPRRHRPRRHRATYSRAVPTTRPDCVCEYGGPSRYAEIHGAFAVPVLVSVALFGDVTVNGRRLFRLDNSSPVERPVPGRLG